MIKLVLKIPELNTMEFIMKKNAAMLCLIVLPLIISAQDVVKIGLNYPKTGPYSVQGLDQYRASELAVEEINAAGGILGKKVEIVWRDSKSKTDFTKTNVTNLIDKDGVQMVFGGSSSGVAIAAGEVCKSKGKLFFGTLTYSTSTTGKDGNKYVFRECYDAWAGARAIASYLNKKFSGKKYFYITADYTWGWTTESSVRKFTGTEDGNTHKSYKTPFPGATEEDFKKALDLAKMLKPDVLVLVLFGEDMAAGIRVASKLGVKKDMQIVVPNLTLGMAESGGAEVMEGVIGALPWCWNIPNKYNFADGKKFVDKFSQKYNRYPSTSGASAYTILYEYKAAVERAGSFDTDAVIKALEGHKYTHLKDEQQWRVFDHQSVQTVYAVKCNPEATVLKDKYKLDYFEILSKLSGEEAFITESEWKAARKEAGKPASL